MQTLVFFFFFCLLVFPFDLFVRTSFCSDSAFPSSTVLGLPPLKSRSTPLWLKRRGEGSHQSKLHPSIWHPSILSSSRKKGHLVKLIDQEWNGMDPKDKQRENRTEVLASAISSSLSSGATVIVGFQIASNLRNSETNISMMHSAKMEVQIEAYEPSSRAA